MRYQANTPQPIRTISMVLVLEIDRTWDMDIQIKSVEVEAQLRTGIPRSNRCAYCVLLLDTIILTNNLQYIFNCLGYPCSES